MYKLDLALNNLQYLIYHKRKPNQTETKQKKSHKNIKFEYKWVCPRKGYI